jgi:hypothetical protein
MVAKIQNGFWSEDIIKEFKMKFYVKRDLDHAYSEFRSKPLDQNYSKT